jgi:signal transduction histidine kinase
VVRGTRYVQQGNLLSTTTFRLAVLYLALFATSAIALLGYVYWNTAGFLTRQTDEAVQAEITGLAEQYAQGGLPQLVQTVIQRSRDPRQSLYLLVDRRGSVLAGNLDRRPSTQRDQNGWLDFEYHRRTMDGAEVHTARARAFDLTDGSFLIVGRDVQELRSIENLITSSLAWAIALTVALGLVGGIIISRNMLARIDAINQTSREIIRGDLSQRVAVVGSGDELDQLAENLNNMLEQIESLMMGMREVTDNIAHDLRSPLNRLRTRLEMAMMQPGSTDEARLELERSISDADHLLSTFNSLLAIARAEAGTHRDTMSSVDLSALVRDAVELYEPVAEDAGIACDVEVEEGLEIFGKAELLAQAIANLMDNAIKHGNLAPNGTARILVRAEKTKRDVRVSVSDNGPGIAEADRKRVLDRFVRLEASRNTPGSGLGLSLVAAAAHLHGGDLILENAEPGLRAVMKLPIGYS